LQIDKRKSIWQDVSQIKGKCSMKELFKIINVQALKEAPLRKDPFPFIIVDNLLYPNAIDEVVGTFPETKHRGSVSLNDVKCHGSFAKLVQELQQEEFRTIIGERFGMNLQNNPSMITVRGYTTSRDGHIHTDSFSKLITVLLYLNPGWQELGGRLRLLYNGKDLASHAAEISPEAGRCVLFKVTPNCWHGHEPFIGLRRSIQLNYMHSAGVKERHNIRHRLSTFLKRLGEGFRISRKI
jgi:SM-20-related protein